MNHATGRTWVLLFAWVLAAGVWCAFRPSSLPPLTNARLEAPSIEFDARGRVQVTAAPEEAVYISTDGEQPSPRAIRYQGPLPLWPDPVRCARLSAVPTSPQWRHPLSDSPSLAVVRARSRGTHGEWGPTATRTRMVPGIVSLPVVSLVLPPGALFDPDSGIYVVGNAVLGGDPEALAAYRHDMRWWKYPGNYHLRGDEAERRAHVEWFEGNGAAGWSGDVDLRIHGNNTRGFPQHALRITFKERTEPLPGMGRHRSLVLRTGGNDQDKAFMRDVVQHRACAGAPFATARAWPVVVFINGAYWGVHEVRERIDDHELAERFDLKAKNITILADRAVLYRGDDHERIRFMRLVQQAERAPVAAPEQCLAFERSMEEELEVDGFLQYMASQILLGNTDWPDQNVKYWRWTGAPGNGVKDGRWRFIMGDSDLGLGYSSDPAIDMFAVVERKNGPVAALLRGLLRDPLYKDRFADIVRELMDGRLAPAALRAVVEEWSARIGPEMDRHCARWRRPLDTGSWQLAVEDLARTITERSEAVHRQVEARFPEH